MRRRLLFLVTAVCLSFIWRTPLEPHVHAQAQEPQQGQPAPQGQGNDGVFIPGAKPIDPGPDAPDMTNTDWKWSFGKLPSGVYNTNLTIHNFCETPEPVSIFVNDMPELWFDLPGCGGFFSSKSCGVIVPPSGLDVAATLRLEKDAKNTYAVDPMAPGATPRPFRVLSGNVVVFHQRNDPCLPNRDVYEVTVDHLADRLYPDPPPPAPEKTAGAGPCEVWWNTGEWPSMLKPDQDCTAIIRPLALGYRERILPPHIKKAPGQWTWLPEPGRISEMSSEELVAMKLKAERQIAR